MKAILFITIEIQGLIMMQICIISYSQITLLKERKTSALKSSTTIIRTFFLISSVASTRVNGKSSMTAFCFNLKNVCIKTKVTGINHNLLMISDKKFIYLFPTTSNQSGRKQKHKKYHKYGITNFMCQQKLKRC